MRAFYRDGDFLAKVYGQVEDWQVIFRGKQERWFSVWENREMESMVNALQSVVEDEGLIFNDNNLEVI